MPLIEPRRIRSFVLRQGRLTHGQTRALEELLPRYALPEGRLDLPRLFGRDARRTLEIGFGNGDALAELAERHPDEDFLGAEVHRPGVGRLLLAIEAEHLSNVRVACEDAVQLCGQRLPDACLDAVLIYFPDPWPKKRHHKRRLLQPEFAALLAQRLKAGGRLHFATDWEEYAEHALAVLSASPEFENSVAEGGYAPRPAERPATRFEQRGLKLGHAVFDLVFRRV
ncbi:MAG TPA: tRNA (guanosine(46)-N7)-methyltransferase TrmB [Gammaproteobacteria bacterium]|jgi:tRNA (guanine-N7-)-methyltransferase|nr:tRNA (guanosine(46)-N7)-methyltransferase TrmB [Gammaproteobacteria bacterium]